MCVCVCARHISVHWAHCDDVTVPYYIFSEAARDVPYNSLFFSSSVSMATSDNNGTFIDTVQMSVFNVRWHSVTLRAPTIL